MIKSTPPEATPGVCFTKKLSAGAQGREQTQKEVADQMGISQSYISRLEKRIIQRLKKEILRLS